MQARLAPLAAKALALSASNHGRPVMGERNFGPERMGECACGFLAAR
jgi:hypothetical protein